MAVGLSTVNPTSQCEIGDKKNRIWSRDSWWLRAQIQPNAWMGVGRLK